MSTIDITEPNEELLLELINDLTEFDRKIFNLPVGQDLLGAIKEDFKASRAAFIGLVDGKPCAALCVKPMPIDFLQNTGFVWLIVGQRFKKTGMAILKASRAYLKALIGIFDKLVAGIDMNNKTNIKYAKFLGFKDSGQVINLNGLSYGLFIKERQ